MRAPAFWAGPPDALLPRLLAPAAALYGAATARRVARSGWRAPVPVLCCGNATAGGAGKTTLALDLGRRLEVRGLAVHVLLRGYGGRERGPLRVDPARHDSRAVGDEALLHAAERPTWVAADRAAGARAAVAAGAQLLLMDDGLQHPGLARDLSLLTIDGAAGFGNGRVIPAGPLREPVAAVAARASAAVLIGEDRRGALAELPPGLPVLHARLRPHAAAAALAGQRVFAFTGIASPDKVLATLREVGAELAGHRAFADHHAFTPAELRRVLAAAATAGARPVTTAKDAVRLPPEVRAAVTVLGVELAWHVPAAVGALLDGLLARVQPSSASCRASA